MVWVGEVQHVGVCTWVCVVLVYIGAWMNVWMSWYGCGQDHICAVNCVHVPTHAIS